LEKQRKKEILIRKEQEQLKRLERVENVKKINK